MHYLQLSARNCSKQSYYSIPLKSKRWGYWSDCAHDRRRDLYSRDVIEISICHLSWGLLDCPLLYHAFGQGMVRLSLRGGWRYRVEGSNTNGNFKTSPSKQDSPNSSNPLSDIRPSLFATAMVAAF
jgi:hypothetical protein